MDSTRDDAKANALANALTNAQTDAKANAPCADDVDEPAILEEIEVEDLAVDGICGVY